MTTSRADRRNYMFDRKPTGNTKPPRVRERFMYHPEFQKALNLSAARHQYVTKQPKLIQSGKPK